jgi:DNA-binding transcriptional LysR family regulator
LEYRTIDMVHLPRIDLNLLVVLEAIYAEGGVSRAGEKLHLGQPAVSHALARLRELFRDPLFVRDGRTLTPTPLTRRLIEPLGRSLRSLGELLDETARFDPRKTQTEFTISLRDPTEARLLPPLLRRLASRAPRIDLRIVQLRRRMLEGALSAGTLDLAIDVPLALSEKVRRRRLAADELVVVARKGHPHAQPGMTLERYLQAEHVMVTSRRKGTALEDLSLGERGLRRRVRLRCRSYAVAVRVVRETDLLLTMPGTYARMVNAGVGNQILSPPVKMPTLDAYLYWHESVEDDAANRWLRDSVVEVFEA